MNRTAARQLKILARCDEANRKTARDRQTQQERDAINTLGNALGYAMKESYDVISSNAPDDIERSRSMWQAFQILRESHDGLCAEYRAKQLEAQS